MFNARTLPALVLAGGMAAFIVFLGLPLIQGTVYTEDDLGAFHLPLRVFYQQCLVAGDSFLWTPYIFNGFYLLGEGQLGMLHPLHALLYRALPLETAFTLELWLSYPFALLGMWLFLRRWDLPYAVALFGGFCFALLGFNLNHYVHMHFVATLAHLPWALLAIDVALRPKGEIRLPIGALLLLFALSVSQLLKAMPQVIVFSWMAEGLYALALMALAARTRGASITAIIRIAALLLIVKVLATGAAAAQLLPLWEGLQSSYRADPDDTFRLSISLHPWNLVQFFNPYLFQRRVYAPFSGDEPWDAVYFGAAAPALLVLLLMRWRSLGSFRWLAGFGFGLALFGLLAALGRYGFVHHFLDWIPVVNKLRAPARYVALFHAGLALALPVALMALWKREDEGENHKTSCPPLKGVPEGRGMLGVGNDVESQSVRESTSPLIPLQRGMMPNDALGLSVGVKVCGAWYLLLPVLGALLSLVLPFLLEAHLVMPLRSALFGAGLVCLGSLLVWACARGLGFAPVLLILFVLADAGLYGLRHKPAQSVDEYLAEIPRPPAEPGTRIDTDIHPTFMNRYGMLGFRAVYGYTALMPDRALDYTHEESLRIAGVEWREARHTASPELAAAVERGETWVPLENTLPRIRLVDDPDALSVLAGDVTVDEDRPGRLRITVRASEDAWLFMGESWHAGWRAAVDSDATQITRAHGDFMTVPIAEGEHTIEFVFDPASYRNGKRITLASLGLSSVFFLLLFYRRSRRSRA